MKLQLQSESTMANPIVIMSGWMAHGPMFAWKKRQYPKSFNIWIDDLV